ncbi:MAG: segregation/condensation protein A [Caulobacteraceae bacterium]|nr:segregation/condensation protein A [Caulobacteraceae bacterium]
MSETRQTAFDFIAAENAAEDGEALIVDLEHYEGPLHVLLALARNQKVDLLQLSVTKLADQYLAFVQGARRVRFSLAADYLVMAAWLAYLKSRLLLPKPAKASGEEPPAEELAAALAFRLAKLDAMRRAVEALNARPQLGRDVFGRGDPEAMRITGDRFEGDLYALAQAYVAQRKRDEAKRYRPRPPQAYPLEEARRRLRGKLSELGAWTTLTAVAPAATLDEMGASGPSRASFIASTLSAGLEMVREGELEVRQAQHFADIYLRARGLHLEAAE